MENKEMKKPIPVELDDEVLDNVSGGAAGTYTCSQCGSTLDSTFCSQCGILIPLPRDEVDCFF